MFKYKLLTSSILIALSSTPVFAWDSFKVESIQYKGLNALSPSMFDYVMKIKPGQNISPDQTNKLLQRLYDTGYFEDVSLSRNGNVLVIDVKEQPTVADIKIKGNELIKTKNLNQVLLNAGLVIGNSVNPVLLKQIRLSLIQEYYNQGKYAARITIKQKKLLK